MLRFKYAYLCLFPLLITGCMYNFNTLEDLEASLQSHNYEQAAVRLQRCANYGPDSDECMEILSKIKENNLTIVEYFKIEHEKEIKKQEKELEEFRVQDLRDSQNPWKKLQLALEIKNGNVKPLFESEVDYLIEQAFFGFGECAKNLDSDCMTQYAQMILYGESTLSENKKIDANKKALYWLNLAARYGNEEARRILISLQKEIPSPDLAMENLQKNANSISAIESSANFEMQKQLLEVQRQLLVENREKNLIDTFQQIHRMQYSRNMQNFFPRAANCTSNTIGTTTYTNCREGY